jgi:hypothetical protein
MLVPNYPAGLERVINNQLTLDNIQPVLQFFLRINHRRVEDLRVTCDITPATEEAFINPLIFSTLKSILGTRFEVTTDRFQPVTPLTRGLGRTMELLFVRALHDICIQHVNVNVRLPTIQGVSRIGFLESGRKHCYHRFNSLRCWSLYPIVMQVGIGLIIPLIIDIFSFSGA